MENIIPKCVKNNKCLIVCNVKICKATPFMCNDDQCPCYSQHQKCKLTLKWKSIRQYFSNKLKKSSQQLAEYFKQIDDIYKSVIKQIEKSFAEIKNISENFGLSQLEREVYSKLKQQKFTELTGESISNLQAESMVDKKQLQIQIIEKEKKQIEKQTTNLVQKLERISKLIILKLDSKITLNIETLLSFFPNDKLKNMNLLYRASQNNFQTSKFWDKCHGKVHTLTIVNTQFGNIIGGYTPLPWDKSKYYNWQTDNSKQSFIFSLTNKHKLGLIKGKQTYAIQNDNSAGPIFGQDLRISDKANRNKDSYARPGDTYNYNNNYIRDSQQSSKKFSGQSKGYGFKISEWQVYQISFK